MTSMRMACWSIAINKEAYGIPRAYFRITCYHSRLSMVWYLTRHNRPPHSQTS